jgi:putative transposase
MAELFHALSRGVDKRKIFLDDQDHFRFIHDMYEFNDQESVTNNRYIFKKANEGGVVVRSVVNSNRKARKLLVHIHAFCLMPNHYHLLLSPVVEGGISKFMKKLNMGYARYFNKRYERKGTLFEGRYKSVPVTAHAHFIHLPYYIHLNPLDMFDHGWRERAIHNHADAMRYLETYRWSSHLDYLGKKNFPSVTQREFLLEFFGGQEGYTQALDQWVKDISVEDIQDVLLEK